MARTRERGLHQIGEENDLKAYQADPSGFLWAVLEVLRHTDAYAEPDFQALIERGRLAAMGQQGMIDHSEDIRKTDQEQRERALEESEPGVGPPRPVMPGEGDSPAAEYERMTEAQEREAEARRSGDVSERRSSPAEEAQRLTGDADDDDDDDDVDEDDLDTDNKDTGRTDAERIEQSENVEPSPGNQGDRAVAERKARERGLEIRAFGSTGDWRVYDPTTGKMVSKMRLDDPDTVRRALSEVDECEVLLIEWLLRHL